MQFDLGCNPFSTQFANYLFQVLVIGVGEKNVFRAAAQVIFVVGSWGVTP